MLGRGRVGRRGILGPVGRTTAVVGTAAVAAHGMSGMWGTLSLGFLAVPKLADRLATGKGGLFYGGGLHQLGTQALGLASRVAAGGGG